MIDNSLALLSEAVCPPLHQFDLATHGLLASQSAFLRTLLPFMWAFIFGAVDVFISLGCIVNDKICFVVLEDTIMPYEREIVLMHVFAISVCLIPTTLECLWILFQRQSENE